MPKKAAKEDRAVTTAKADAPSRPRKAISRNKNGSAAEPSKEDIALRAYFISEQRRREGRAGEEGEDWAEAERQLRTEQASPKPRRKKSE